MGIYRWLCIRWLNLRCEWPVGLVWVRRRDTWNLDDFAERCLIRAAETHMRQTGRGRMEWLKTQRLQGDELGRRMCNAEYRRLQLIDAALKVAATTEKDWPVGCGQYEKALNALWRSRGVMWN